MGQVEGKIVIVTGGASGIGAACAATLAREGAKVVITDLDDAGGQAVADKIGRAGGEAFSSSGRQLRGKLARSDRRHRATLWTIGRYGGQRRHRDLMRGDRNVAG